MARTGLRPIDELILLAKNGNGLAFTALWDRHIDQLRSYIKNRFKNIDDYDVDDISHDDRCCIGSYGPFRR